VVEAEGLGGYPHDRVAALPLADAGSGPYIPKPGLAVAAARDDPLLKTCRGGGGSRGAGREGKDIEIESG
jgi:hypothetical protein